MATDLAARPGEKMTATEPGLPLQQDHDKAIAALSDKSRASAQEVERIYRKEFARLAGSARIPNFLVILAMNNTRSILRRGAA
jgi:hypothetical protein